MRIIKKSESLTKRKCFSEITWKTENIRWLFNLKNTTRHVPSVVYEGACNCGWNVATSSDENCGISNDSEAAEYLYQFLEHKFNCKNLRKVLSKVRKRKIHKSILRNMFILYPSILNNQVEFASTLRLVSLGFYLLQGKRLCILV